MKTTIDIEDELLKAAKKRAIDEGTTLRQLVEDGLRVRLRGPNAGAGPAANLRQFLAERKRANIAAGLWQPDGPVSPTPSRDEIYPVDP